MYFFVLFLSSCSFLVHFCAFFLGLKVLFKHVVMKGLDHMLSVITISLCVCVCVCVQKCGPNWGWVGPHFQKWSYLVSHQDSELCTEYLACCGHWKSSFVYQINRKDVCF